MKRNRATTVAALAFALSGCAGSQSATPPVPPNTLNMSITNGTHSAVVMGPGQIATCMERVPPKVTLEPNRRWQGTIALDTHCPQGHWSFGITFSASFPGASAEWSKGENGHWLLLYLASGLRLVPKRGPDGLFDITLVQGRPQQ